MEFLNHVCMQPIFSYELFSHKCEHISPCYVKTKIRVFLLLPFKKLLHIWPDMMKRSLLQAVAGTFKHDSKRRLLQAPLYKWGENLTNVNQRCLLM